MGTIGIEKGISERRFAELGPKCRSALSPSVDQDMLGRNSERTFWAEHHLSKNPRLGNKDKRWPVGHLPLAEKPGGVSQTWHVYVFSRKTSRNPC